MTQSRYNYIGVLILFFLLVLPGSASAYLTTDQHALSLDGTTGIYLIDFEFGHGDHDVYIPIFAQHSPDTDSNSLSYSILDDEDETGKGTVTGIVLSDAEIVDGMYRIPKGVLKRFTLFVIYTQPEQYLDRKTRLQVTHLPFSFNGTQELQLNLSELQYYTTKFLSHSQ